MRTTTRGWRERLMVWALFGVAALVVASSEALAQTQTQTQTPIYYYYPSSGYTNGYAPSTVQGGYYWTTAAPSQPSGVAYTYGSAPTTYAAPVYQAAAAPVYTYQYYQPATAPTAPQVVQTVPAAETAPAPATVTAPAAPASASGTANTATAAAPAGDPYGFLSWLNATRASYGLSAVGYDPNLSSWAAMNNNQQAARGLGHYVMGPARRQNAAVGGFPDIESMWMASPAHRAALLDPTIRWIGIAGMGAYWTFNAN